MTKQDRDNRLAEISDKMARLKNLFVKHDRFLELESRISSIAEQRRAELRAGLQLRCEGVTVVGESGVGKTRALEKIRASFCSESRNAPDGRVGEFVSLLPPSQATVKFTGIATLAALHFEIKGSPNNFEIWRLVEYHLEKHKVLFLHFDEAQDFILSQSGREAYTVINTLKSLTQSDRWPVSVILSGLPVLADVLDSDFQLGRRMAPMYLEDLKPDTDIDDIEFILSQYLEAANLKLDLQNAGDDFYSRLIVAASFQLGLVFEIILAAIRQALLAKRLKLTIADFADVYRTRSGAVNAANPFFATDYLGINTRVFLEGRLKKRKGRDKNWRLA